MNRDFYPNEERFDPEFPTFTNVLLEMPPLMNESTGLQNTDDQDTFGDVDGNEGENLELAVEGFVEAQPAVVCEIELNRIVGGCMANSMDCHIRGRNLELISSYAPGALKSGQWVSVEMVEEWKGEENIINPDAGFTREQLLRWIYGYIGKEGYNGYSVFRDHAYPESPFFQINELARRAIDIHPRTMTYRKGQRASTRPGMTGFVPKSYSAVRDSMGTSWGMSEYFEANGAKVLHHVGTCLDICAGETVLDAAASGKQQWINVDGGAVLRLAIAGEVTTEHIMLKKLLEHENVHFYNTALTLKRHEHLIPFMSAEMQSFAYAQLQKLNR